MIIYPLKIIGRVFGALLLLTGLLLQTPLLLAIEADAPVVKLNQAEVRGRIETGVASYRGIPYAQPPVGELRWQAAQKAAPFQGVLEAKKFGAACMQPIRPQNTGLDMSEDCLTVNVWRPATEKKNLPVMVWIHGGGFMSGSGRIPGEALATEDVVVVSFNYRLGPLGFFAHPRLDSDIANFGLTDAIQALHWVQENIAVFGGDPNNVSIFGVSAGGMMVNLLLVSETEGLFQKAISQSGYITWPLPATASQLDKSVLDIGGNAMEIAENFGASLVAPLLEAQPEIPSGTELRSLSAKHLVQQVRGFMRPIVDGVTLQDQPWRLTAQRSRNVSLISGGNSFEGSIMPHSGISMDSYRNSWRQRDTIFKNFYKEDFIEDEKLAFSRAFGDERYLLSSWHLGQTWQQKPAPVWLYFIDLAPGPDLPGSPHGMDQQLLFNAEQIDNRELKSVALNLRRYWINFAREGNPNGKGLPDWSAYTTEHPDWLIMGTFLSLGEVKRDIMPVLFERLLERENTTP